VFRYPGAYGKLRADEAGAEHVALARAVIAQGIRTPAPLAYRPELGMALYEEAFGTRLATLRGGDLEPWMEPLAETLAALQATDIPGLREHSVEGELADLRAAAATATALGVDCLDLAEELVRRLAAVEPHTTTIHGSFHDDQVLVGDDGVMLVDLDSAARGHPLLDVGHFAAYLTAAGEEAARERFLVACNADTDVFLFEAAALLRWSSLPFRDLEPGWPAAVARRVQLARERLASSLITAS
jgi:aminoglycoside phosphotransferase (APT) family kinase protein